MDNGYSYSTDQLKIDCCVDCMDSKEQLRWSEYEKQFGFGNTTFDRFKEFVLDGIDSKRNRRFGAQTDYQSAMQGGKQSIQDFAIYLSSLERELGITDDSTRAMTLFGKLRNELQSKIVALDEDISTRNGLIALGSRIEGASLLSTRISRGEPSKGDRIDSGDYPTQSAKNHRQQGAYSHANR
jgi:hypothetical protein